MPDGTHQPFHLIRSSRSVGDENRELTRLREEIAARDRQETAMAELGQAALTGVDPYLLLGQACALVELTLGVSHCRVLELIPGGRMVLRASIGSNDTFVQCAHEEEESDSLSMVVLLDGPITFTRIEHETRFQATHLRDKHGVWSGAGVPIRTQYGPFGVLLAYAGDERMFEDYELAFLKATANILGEALARFRTEEELRKSESRLKQLIASTLDAVITVDNLGVVIEWNPQAEEIFGISARSVVGKRLPVTLTSARYLRVIERMLERYRSGGKAAIVRRRVEAIARRANGEEFPVEVTIDPVGRGAERTFTAFVRDISERKRAQAELEQSERRFRTIVEKSWSGVALLDANIHFSFAGSSTAHILGYDEEDLVGTSFFDYVHPRERDAALRTFDKLCSGAIKEAQGELRFRHCNGTWVWIEGFAQNLLGDSSVGAIVLNYRDVTQRRATEKQLEYQAYYDALTGLPNRLLFRDRVVNALAQVRRNQRGLAIMYLDLDHFKLVNDGLGHSFGDALLSNVARRLQSALRASDTISRIGGDEFSILVTDVPNSEAVAGIARKVLDALAEPFRVEGHDLYVSASVGISFYPTDGDEVETLLKCADAAMYRAKELGRNQAQLFTPSMNERYVRRLAIEQSLHQAIEREEFDVHYQPIYDRARRRVESVEALMRWNHPQRGMVPPSEFIGLAEETGLIVPMGLWVLRRACEQLRQWDTLGLTWLKMAVNISVHQFQQADFANVIRETIAATGIDARRLQLEITETAAVQNVDRTMRALRELKAMGVEIAVDDFGTGMSSLIYLKQFPIDTVKIDKEFLRDITEDDTAAAIVSYVINLAHTLGLNVVAEGVETEEQYLFLRHYACDLVQGFLFSRPLPPDELASYIQHQTH